MADMEKFYDDLMIINLYLYAILIISLKLNMKCKMFSELYFFSTYATVGTKLIIISFLSGK